MESVLYYDYSKAYSIQARNDSDLQVLKVTILVQGLYNTKLYSPVYTCDEELVYICQACQVIAKLLLSYSLVQQAD